MQLLRIVYFLIGLFAIICFIISLIVFFAAYIIIFSLFNETKAPHIAHALSRIWAKYCFLITFIRVRIEGKELIDPSKTYVFVANHQSQLDIPLYAIACKNTFRFLSKAELTKIPLMGYLIKKLYLTVDRSDKTDRSKSIQLMKKSLEEGISVFLCPEGTRNRTNQPLLELKDGAFRVAIESQLPIAVLTVIDTRNRNRPKSPLELKPGPVHAVWHKPIETKGMNMDDLSKLKIQVKEIMLNNINRYKAQGISAF